MPVLVVFWQYTIFLFETFREVAGVRETHEIDNLIHAVRRGAKQFCGTFQALVADKVGWRESCNASHLTVQTGTTHAEVAGQRIDRII